MLVAFLFLGRKVRPGFTVAVLAAMLLATPFLPASFWNADGHHRRRGQDKAEFTGSREARRILMEEGIRCVPRTTDHRCRRRDSSRTTTPRTQGAVARNAQCAAAGRGRDGHLRVRGVRVPDRLRRGRGPPGAPHAGAARAPHGRSPGPHGQRRRSQVAATRIATAMPAGLIGWFVCALFASVAYSWTFYYLLALIVATRESGGQPAGAGARPDAGQRRRPPGGGRRPFERRRAPRGRRRSPEPRQRRARSYRDGGHSRVQRRAHHRGRPAVGVRSDLHRLRSHRRRRWIDRRHGVASGALGRACQIRAPAERRPGARAQRGAAPRARPLRRVPRRRRCLAAAQARAADRVLRRVPGDRPPAHGRAGQPRADAHRARGARHAGSRDDRRTTRAGCTAICFTAGSTSTR